MLDSMANISKTKLVEEGIDFDLANLTVSYNPNHEENVDTSEWNNPSKDAPKSITVLTLLSKLY